MEDWEAEYEAERQRVLGGGAVAAAPPRRQDPAGSLDEYSPADAGCDQVGPQAAGPQAGAGGGAVAPPPASAERRWEHEADGPAGGAAVDLAAYPTLAFFEKNIDTRFNLPIAALPAAAAAYSTKIGRMLFCAAPAGVYFKSFFGHSKSDGFVFVTARCVYFGAAGKPQLWVAKDIHGLRSLHLFGDGCCALRSKQGPDAVFVMGAEDRAALAAALPRLFLATGERLSVLSVGMDRWKPFRNGASFLPAAEWPFELVEDPRTGIALTAPPPDSAGVFHILLPKLLHWFGHVTHVVKNSRHLKRVMWLSPTCLFVNDVGALMPDGRGIRRCVGLEYVHTVFVGKDASRELGLKIVGGPKQPDLMLVFDSEATLRLVLFIMQRCFYFRVGQPLLQKTVGSVKQELALVDEDKLRAEIFVMRTRDDLLELLRKP